MPLSAVCCLSNVLADRDGAICLQLRSQKKRALLRSSETRALSSTDSSLWEYAVSECRTYRRLIFGICTVLRLSYLLMPPVGFGPGHGGAPAVILQGSKLTVGWMPGPENPSISVHAREQVCIVTVGAQYGSLKLRHLSRWRGRGVGCRTVWTDG